MISPCENCDPRSKEMCSKLKSPEDVIKNIREKGQGNTALGLSNLLDSDSLVIYACWTGRHLSGPSVELKTAQVRKFYEAVMGIRDSAESKKKVTEDDNYFINQVKPKIVMLKPQIAFATAKQRRQMEPLFIIINPCLSMINNHPDFIRLAQFMEAIVAYHKFHGGRD